MIKPAAYVGSKDPAHDPSIVPVKTRGSRKRRSPYRELLERLLDSPKNSVLRVKDVDARHAFRKQAQALGYEAVFAQRDGFLYVKIGGVTNQEPQFSGQRAAAVQKSMLEAVAHAPMTATEVARVLGSDSASCEAMLSYLVKAGLVERDDGLGNQAIYRAM
jgi:hypothetical protein